MDPIVLGIVALITIVLIASIRHNYANGNSENDENNNIYIKDPDARLTMKRNTEAIAALERYLESEPNDKNAQNTLHQLKQKHRQEFGKHIN